MGHTLAKPARPSVTYAILPSISGKYAVNLRLTTFS